ncbi:ATP-binding protein [Nocardioides flavescens]|nr:ATP-binding protein [Nocardioides flavescens]
MGRPTPHWVQPTRRAIVWGLLCALAGEIGVHTTLHDVPLSLVAPNAAVVVLWFAFGTRRTLPYDLAALSVVGLLIGERLGLPLLLVVTSPLVLLAQAASFVVVLRRLAPGLAPHGGREDWALRDLAAFVAAAVTSALAMAATATGTQWLAGLPSGDLAAFLTRWGRSTATITAVGALGLLLGPALHRAWRERRVAAWVRGGLTTSPARRIELGFLLVTAVALNVTCFVVLEGLPLTFVLFVVVAWVGIRFSAAAVAAYSLASGTFALIATLEGHGVFAVTIDDPYQRAVVAQLFVMVTACTGLVLAIARAQLIAAEALAESRLAMLDQVLAEVDDGIALFEGESHVLMINRAGKELFENFEAGTSGPTRPAEEIQLYHFDGTRVTDDNSPHRRALRGQVIKGEDFELRRPDGSVLRYLRMNAEALPPAELGGQPRVLVTYHDITGDRLRQDALATFAGHVAHDLRNPLSVVEAWNEVLTDTVSHGEQLTPEVLLPMTTRIGVASARMRDFIKGLLDYTLARDRTLQPEAVDLVALASDVAALRELRTDDAEPPVIKVLGAGTALADRELIRIVLDNLVANACKYVAPGVRPRVMVLVEELDALTVEVCVADNGIGIPADQRQRIFESFHRVERAGRFEGTGLGLGICRRIVERHRGTISVEDVREGACLRVTLPRAVGRRAAASPDQPISRSAAV